MWHGQLYMWYMVYLFFTKVFILLDKPDEVSWFYMYMYMYVLFDCMCLLRTWTVCCQNMSCHSMLAPTGIQHTHMHIHIHIQVCMYVRTYMCVMLLQK